MTPFLDQLATRRSLAPHRLLEPGPNPDEVKRLLAVAARTPDHGRLVPWRFVVIAGDARHRIGEALAGFFAKDNPQADAERLQIERERLARAPLVIGVVSRAAPHVKIPEWEQILSAGALCMNVTHAANAMGYTTAWLTEWYAYDRRVLDLLGLTPRERIAGFIHIGQRGDPALERERPDMDRIVSYL